jgi:hypothetical protein
MNDLSAIEEAVKIREDPKLWFERFGRFCDEQTRLPTRGPANVLQRRMFEHYRRCRQEGKPCRMVVLKYRRAGSSTGSEALIYMHAQNYRARLGVIGTITRLQPTCSRCSHSSESTMISRDGPAGPRLRNIRRSPGRSLRLLARRLSLPGKIGSIRSLRPGLPGRTVLWWSFIRLGIRSPRGRRGSMDFMPRRWHAGLPEGNGTPARR